MGQQPIIAKSQLISDLRALGLAEGQTVMLHASVKNIGWIVGGPDVVIEAVLEVVGEDGTLMMLTSWEDIPHGLASWPKDRQEAYLAECPAFDPARSRADHRHMSILAEYLRTRPHSYRSRHPYGYAAVGKRAEWITSEQPWQYREGKGSPLEKLCEASGYVVVLGAPLANVTLLHHSEHIAKVPNKRVDRYKMPILRDGRRTWVEFEEYDTSHGIVDWPDDYFETIIHEYLAAGNGRTGRVGAADAYQFGAASLNAFAIRWMEEHFNQARDTSSMGPEGTTDDGRRP